MATAFAGDGSGVGRWERGSTARLHHPRDRDLRHVGGVRGLPLIGAMPLILPDPDRFFARLHARHGQVYRFHALGRWHLHALGPEAHEKVLFDAGGDFSARLGWGPLVEPLLPGAVLIQDGAEHRRRRRILGEAFKGAELRRSQEVLAADVRRHVDGWVGQVDVFREAKRLSFDVATSTFMGLPLGDEARRALRWFADLAGGLVSVSYNPWLSLARMRGLASKRRLESFLAELVRERRRVPGDDFLSRMSCQTDESGRYLPEQDILDAFIFLLVAAHDTASSAITSCVWFLASHPDWAERMRGELAERHVGSAELAGVADLPVMTMFIKEALRLRPPAPIVWRRSLAPASVCGRRIPAGTMVGVNLVLSHRLPEVWPDPESFDPLRFLPERELERGRFAYAPFGAGVHKCLGMHFAQQQVKTVLAQLLLTRELARPTGEPRWYGWPSCRPRGRLLLQVDRLSRGS